MKKDERWVYTDGKLVGKTTTKSYDNGDKEIVRQKAHQDFWGNHATEVTSRTKIKK
ncbi:MAG: hypothetical protein NUV74_14075 [Candidatus Brocadiaceae bacterium]|nr:hypothetical protein [Candidatus Brocadiaceae bacterium]